jgi:hypothetical protein
MSKGRIVTIEGFTPEQLLARPREELNALVLCSKPLVFRVGTAEVLGSGVSTR